MNISIEAILLGAAIMLMLSILISKTGYRFGVPTLLTFLIAGMIFGSDGFGIQFNDAETAQKIGMVALCIILFSGGIDTKMSDIRPVLAPGLMLSTAGVLLTTVFVGLFVYLNSCLAENEFFNFSLLGSLLLAATMSSTDSASVFNILRSQNIRLKNNLRPMLELESGSNDPMAYLLTILLIQCMQIGQLSAGEIALSFVLQFAVGVAGGYLLGRAGVWAINHVNLRNRELYFVLILCFIFIIYGTVFLLHGNGYLAVYIAGMVMGNCRLFMKKEISTYLDGMTWLLQVVLFIMLGLLVNPHDMLSVTFTSILVSIFMVVVARPAAVWLSLIPFGKKISNKSKLFVSWCGLRGAAPIIFATYPVVAQIDGASQIFNIVFFVTLFSLIIQGTSLTQMARRLDLVDDTPEPVDSFGIELPEEIDGKLQEIACTPEMFAKGNRICDLQLSPGVLVMLVKGGDRVIIPKGKLELEDGDRLLLISENADSGKGDGAKVEI